MKKTTIQLSAIVLVGFLASCSAPSAKVTRMPVSISAGKTSSSSSSSLSGQVFNEVNSYRVQNGKNTLERHAGLDRIAQEHCDFLVRNCGGNGLNISHEGFSLRAFNANKYYSIPSLGENVVSSHTKTASNLLRLWVSSKAHEKNMRSSWKYTGIGTAVTPDGMVISTQLFGSSESTANLNARDFARPW